MSWSNFQNPNPRCYMGGTVTLGRFLYHCIGERVVIELKDETAVEGRLTFCDVKSLNVELEEAIIYRRRAKNLQPLRVDAFFARGRSVRFVHFANSGAARRTLAVALRGK